MNMPTFTDEDRPTVTPNEPAVAAGAEALFKQLGNHLGEWEDQPGHVKNWYAVAALDVLTAACPLVAVTTDNPEK